MHRRRLTLLLILLALLALGSTLTAIATPEDAALAVGAPVFVEPPGPRTAQYPPRPPLDLPAAGPKVSPEAPGTLVALPPLKAVLIVGPIDGDNGSWTNAEKQNMDLAATELASNGVTVHKFYAPNNDWNAIKAAASGAHFIFYRGHGIYWSAMPSPTVGGFALKDRFVSSDDIRNDLRPARNAIVMLYGCFTAGTSSNDTGSISSAEAQRRVAMYSDPFLDIGAAGYYADWFGDAFQKYVRYLFAGKTLGQAYESFYDLNPSTVERYGHPNHPGKAMWLDKDYWDGRTQYNNAFAGVPNLGLVDLVRTAEMQVSPAAVTQVTEPNGPAGVFRITVAAGGVSLRWQAAFTQPAPPWASLAATSGDSSQPVVVTLTPGTRGVGRYTATLRITTDTSGISNAQQTVPMMLHVMKEVRQALIPLVAR